MILLDPSDITSLTIMSVIMCKNVTADTFICNLSKLVAQLGVSYACLPLPEGHVAISRNIFGCYSWSGGRGSATGVCV